MTKFRGCIDIHQGIVKQIVGGSLNDSNDGALQTNYVAEHPPEYFAELYREKGVEGSHVIKLGPGCDEAARRALKAWPRGLQIGGGISDANAREWLDAGAQKIIVTSWLFPNGEFSMERLNSLLDVIDKEELVIDLSCRRKGDGWYVATNRWQTISDFEVTKRNVDMLANHCSEFLVHAADVEGLCRGIDQDLVRLLSQVTIPCTYAGGAHDIQDMATVHELSHGRVDLTYGSALDIFGGHGVSLEECLAWNTKLFTS